MATYALPKVPDVLVTVRGKDSLSTRHKALDKIAEMSSSGELSIEVLNGLSTDQLILSETPAKTTEPESDEEQEPLSMAVRELHKFLLLKIKTQRLKQLAVQARQNIDTILTLESIEQDLDQLEETVKGDYKTLKEFVLALGEYRQAKAGAESALAILDEALQFKLSITTTPSSLAETEGFGSNTKEKTAKTGTTDTEGEVTNERSKNGFNRKLERNGALLQ